MGLLSLDITCPHCLRDNAVLEGFAEKIQGRSGYYDVAFSCRSCEKSFIAEIKTMIPGDSGPLHNAKQLSNRNILIPNEYYTIITVHPEPRQHSAPDDTPPRAAKFFIEAKENFHRGNYETCVMLCRKVLDIATRELLGDESGKEQLSPRISMLFAKGKITEQMKDWAHIVRIDSNGAVHSDEEFSEEESSQMINFTEVFMIYSFTLPSMVTAKQSQKATA